MRNKNLLVKSIHNPEELNLHDVLKSGYKYAKKEKNSTSNVEKHGYVLDKGLSNHNHQTYYNKTQNKLLFNVNGTHNASDWITDVKLGLGILGSGLLGAKNPFGIGFKENDRYKQSHKALRDAKTKYSVDNAVVTGHSLGHAVASGISSKNDKVMTLDGAYTLGQKTRPNTTHYRTQGDLVSSLSSGKNTVTLKNPNGQQGFIKAHNIDNIKGQKIII